MVFAWNADPFLSLFCKHSLPSLCFCRAERPMKVEIAIDPNAMQSLASRVNAPAAAAGGRGAGRAAAGAKPRNGGRAAGSGRSSKPRAPRPAKKTVEDLDAEMAVSIDLPTLRNPH